MYPRQMNIREDYPASSRLHQSNRFLRVVRQQRFIAYLGEISQSKLSCSRSSSRMQGVSELRGATISNVLVSTFPTPPLWQLLLHSRAPISSRTSALLNIDRRLEIQVLTTKLPDRGKNSFPP